MHDIDWTGLTRKERIARRREYLDGLPTATLADIAVGKGVYVYFAARARDALIHAITKKEFGSDAV